MHATMRNAYILFLHIVFEDWGVHKQVHILPSSVHTCVYCHFIIHVFLIVISILSVCDFLVLYCCYSWTEWLDDLRLIGSTTAAELTQSKSSCVECWTETSYPNNQPYGLGESCAKDERHAKNPEAPLHLRTTEEKTSRSMQNSQEKIWAHHMQDAFLKEETESFTLDVTLCPSLKSAALVDVCVCVTL